MGIIKDIHHLELMTKSLDSLCNYLIKAFGFRLISAKKDENILQSGSAILVAKSLPDYHLPQIDTVFNVALEVKTNINDIIDNARDNEVKIIRNPERITDRDGYIDIAQLSSCVGNVIHTIIDKRHYKGGFLPGYDIHKRFGNNANDYVKSFDHIAFVVEKHQSLSVINWYSKVFDMKRFLINRNDLMDEGYILHHRNNGMRLSAFEYWKCDGDYMVNNDELCKFVIAEELNNLGGNQINNFLKDHSGPGIQHVGLAVDNIVYAARESAMNGAKFLHPQNGYYDIIKNNSKLDTLKSSMADLEKCGVLIDAETDFSLSDNSKTDSILYQIFTEPIFDQNTFFLELIQREGARGFGAGNIKALWEAVYLSMNIDENSKEQH